MLDAKGSINEIPASAADYRILDLSPDDRTVAVAVDERFEQGDVWLVPLGSGDKSRLTFTRAGAISGAFSPDGSRFASSSGFYGQAITVDVHSLVSSRTEKVIETSGACILGGWSHDGKYLVVDTQEPKTGFDVQKIDVATRTMTPVVHGHGHRFSRRRLAAVRPPGDAPREDELRPDLRELVLGVRRDL